MKKNLSIEQLENNHWGKVHFPTPLIEKCFNYRKIPVSQLTVEQVRLLISQKIGVRFIISRAISFLEKNILAEGDHYPGDLLSVIFNLSDEDWKHNLKERNRFTELIKQNEAKIEAIGNTELIEKIKSLQSSL